MFGMLKLRLLPHSCECPGSNGASWETEACQEAWQAQHCLSVLRQFSASAAFCDPNASWTCKVRAPNRSGPAAVSHQALQASVLLERLTSVHRRYVTNCKPRVRRNMHDGLTQNRGWLSRHAGLVTDITTPQGRQDIYLFRKPWCLQSCA